MEELKNQAYVSDDDSEIDLIQLLSDTFKHARRMWWMYILFIVAGAVAMSGVLFFSRTPMYQSSASFTVATGEANGSYGFYYDSGTADQLSLTFPYILQSSFFRSMLLEQLGTDRLNGTISAETISGSNVVTMTVQSTNPQDAYTILLAAIDIYPEAARFVLGNLNFSMLTQPFVADKPFNRPSMEKSIFLGAVLGLAVSHFISLLVAIFRKNVNSVDEMKKITSIRCLAMLPRIHVKARTEKKEARMTLCNPSLPHRYKESIRLLKNRAEKAMKQHGGRVYLITSTSSGEGKSLTSVNFAMQLAMDGARVLLIDGDLRKQGDGSLLNVTSRCGLTEVIKAPSEEELWNRVQKNSQLLKVKNLYFIGNSRRSQQTAALLSSDKVKRTFRTLLKFVDYIVIDSPPVGMFQDAALLAEYADGILYLVGYDQLSAGSVREGIQTLSGRRVPFLGYAFNNCPDNGRTYGYGRYGYGKYGYGKYGYGGYGAPAENTEAE